MRKLEAVNENAMQRPLVLLAAIVLIMNQPPGIVENGDSSVDKGESASRDRTALGVVRSESSEPLGMSWR